MYTLILLIVAILMIVYHFERSKVTKDVNTAFYYIFLFIFAWITTRAVYFTDTWINYNWIYLGFMSAIPLIFTFICFTVAIDSM